MFEAGKSEAQACLILRSYRKMLGKDLIEFDEAKSIAEQLYNVPMVVLSHGTQDDPIFNFGSALALERFELTWEELIKLPSR